MMSSRKDGDPGAAARAHPSRSGDLALERKERHAGGVRYAPLLLLAGVFIAVDVVVDLMLADSPGTLHHPRPLLLMLPALLLVAVLWRARDQVGTLGRVGVGLCTTGGVANMVCTVVDGDGIRDCIRFNLSHYLIVINLADILIVTGLVLGAGRDAGGLRRPVATYRA